MKDNFKNAWFDRLIVGIAVTLNGILLQNVDNIYQYPPGWVSVIDNDNFDLAIIIAGIALIITCFVPTNKSKYVQLVEASINGLNVFFLTFVLIETVIHACSLNMYILLSCAIFILALLAIFIKAFFK